VIPKYSAKAELLAHKQTTRASKMARARLGIEDSDDEFEDVDGEGLFKKVWKKVKKPVGKLAISAGKTYALPVAKRLAEKGALAAGMYVAGKVAGGGRGGALRPAGSGVRRRPIITGRALFAA